MNYYKKEGKRKIVKIGTYLFSLFSLRNLRYDKKMEV